MQFDAREISPLIREKAPLILAEIKKARSILLHCHPSPDPDSVGSALAMKFALEQLGKKATVIRGDSEIPQAFMHFPGAGEIVKKNFGEVDLKEFDLFLIQDTASPEMVSRKFLPTFPLAIKTIVIDHHATNASYADINLVDLSSPATAFIIFQLFKEWGIEITPDIAADLFIGIYSDTGGLKYHPTDHRVFMAMADLVKVFPDFGKMVFTIENSETKDNLYFQAMALGSIELSCGDNLAMTVVSNADLLKKGINKESARGDVIANMLKSVIGWNIGVSIVEIEPDKIKMNFRTRDADKFDVSKLAAAVGGGGHRAAAAAVVSGISLSDAKALVVAKAKELYNL